MLKLEPTQFVGANPTSQVHALLARQTFRKDFMVERLAAILFRQANDNRIIHQQKIADK